MDVMSDRRSTRNQAAEEEEEEEEEDCLRGPKLKQQPDQLKNGIKTTGNGNAEEIACRRGAENEEILDIQKKKAVDLGELTNIRWTHCTHILKLKPGAAAKPVIPQSRGRTHHPNINDRVVWKQSPGSRALEARGHRSYHVNRGFHIVRTSQEKQRPTNRDIGDLSRCGPRTTSGTKPQRSVKAVIRITFGGTGEIRLWGQEQNLDNRSYDHLLRIRS
ncbi:hypothetical protein DFH09DRAFT_1099967 [Mycena vulgaris]|nr:hypothetical protein DFH09DRAFT_1099967 [Mycena vulgaris]